MRERYTVLLLGAGGFVGQYLNSALQTRLGREGTVISTSLRGSQEDGVLQLDLEDVHSVRAVLEKFRPTHVVNLAGLASPVAAQQDPDRAWALHAIAPAALGRMLMQIVPDSWLLHVSSGLVYGRTSVEAESVSETCLLAPLDTYAVTKAAGDLAVGALCEGGLNAIRLRPFNHTGPGQTESFAVPAFAAQLASIASGNLSPVLNVGNLKAERDFLDVRDVVNAYVNFIFSTGSLRTGSVYNVCSGVGVTMETVLTTLLELSGLDVEVVVDPTRQRPNDVRRMVGNPMKLRQDLNWSPRYSLHETLSDTYRFFLSRKGQVRQTP